MKKLTPFLFIVLVACNSSAPEKTAADSTTAHTDSVCYRYPIGYSAKFEFIDPAKGKLVLGLWKSYDNNMFDGVKDKFADTVTLIFPGASMHTTRDSAIAGVMSDRASYTTVISKVDVVMSVRSTDKKGDWVLVWGDETHTNKTSNKTDSVAVHEVWGFNNDGKVWFMQHYESKK